MPNLLHCPYTTAPRPREQQVRGLPAGFTWGPSLSPHCPPKPMWITRATVAHRCAKLACLRCAKLATRTAVQPYDRDVLDELSTVGVLSPRRQPSLNRRPHP